MSEGRAWEMWTRVVETRGEWIRETILDHMRNLDHPMNWQMLDNLFVERGLTSGQLPAVELVISKMLDEGVIVRANKSDEFNRSSYYYELPLLERLARA